MSTSVKVRADGVVLHRHPKANDPEGKKWHPAKEVHRGQPGLHEEHDAAHAEGLDKLTAKQKKDYLVLNLAGKEPSWATADWKVKTADFKARKAVGAVRAHACDERCRNASPMSECECQCGGVNHAIAFRGILEKSPEEVKPGELILTPPAWVLA